MVSRDPSLAREVTVGRVLLIPLMVLLGWKKPEHYKPEDSQSKKLTVYVCPCVGMPCNRPFRAAQNGVCRFYPNQGRVVVRVVGRHEAAGSCPKVTVRWPDGRESEWQADCDPESREGFSQPFDSGYLTELEDGAAISIEARGAEGKASLRIPVERLQLGFAE